MSAGTELIETHDRLREALLSFPVDCLALSSLVTAHHTDEDATVFPALAAAQPALAPVLAELRRDHEIIAALIARFGESPADLDTLAVLLETHFTLMSVSISRSVGGSSTPGAWFPASAAFPGLSACGTLIDSARRSAVPARAR